MLFTVKGAGSQQNSRKRVGGDAGGPGTSDHASLNAAMLARPNRRLLPALRQRGPQVERCARATAMRLRHVGSGLHLPAAAWRRAAEPGRRIRRQATDGPSPVGQRRRGHLRASIATSRLLVTCTCGTVFGERQQTGMIDSDDGYQAVSSPDWLAGPDPQLPFGVADWPPNSRHSDQGLRAAH